LFSSPSTFSFPPKGITPFPLDKIQVESFLSLTFLLLLLPLRSAPSPFLRCSPPRKRQCLLRSSALSSTTYAPLPPLCRPNLHVSRKVRDGSVLLRSHSPLCPASSPLASKTFLFMADGSPLETSVPLRTARTSFFPSLSDDPPDSAHSRVCFTVTSINPSPSCHLLSSHLLSFLGHFPPNPVRNASRDEKIPPPLKPLSVKCLLPFSSSLSDDFL